MRPYKIRLRYKYFAVNFAKFLRRSFLHNNSGRLLLFIRWSIMLNTSYVGVADIFAEVCFSTTACFLEYHIFLGNFCTLGEMLIQPTQSLNFLVSHFIRLVFQHPRNREIFKSLNSATVGVL